MTSSGGAGLPPSSSSRCRPRTRSTPSPPGSALTPSVRQPRGARGAAQRCSSPPPNDSVGTARGMWAWARLSTRTRARAARASACLAGGRHAWHSTQRPSRRGGDHGHGHSLSPTRPPTDREGGPTHAFPGARPPPPAASPASPPQGIARAACTRAPYRPSTRIPSPFPLQARTRRRDIPPCSTRTFLLPASEPARLWREGQAPPPSARSRPRPSPPASLLRALLLRALLLRALLLRALLLRALLLRALLLRALLLLALLLRARC